MTRLNTILLTVAGMLVLAAILIRGRNLRTALRTGPGWRRRCLAMALASLAAVGLLSPERACAAVLASATAAGALTDRELAKNDDWRELLSAWNAARDIAAGKIGPYPFLNDDTKKEFLAWLDRARESCQRLARENLLTAAEAGLLEQGVADLHGRVSRFRPKTMMMATCYKPAAFHPAKDSASRLQARLGLLEQLAAQTAIRRVVLDQVLANIEADIAVLADPNNRANLTAEEQAQHAQVRETAAKFLAKIKATEAAVEPVAQTEEWQAIIRVWTFCRPLAKSGESTKMQRLQVAAKLDGAREAIAALVAKKLLQEQEAQLLYQEADLLRDQINRNPPVPSQGFVSCYVTGPPPIPARASWQRLAQRLPLLVELHEAGKLQRAVVDSLLPTLERDLARLEYPLDELTEGERQQVPELRETARASLKKLKQAR